MDRADMRVAYKRGDTRLPPEPFSDSRLFGFRAGKDFDSDVALESKIARPVDHSVAIPANILEQPIVRDDVAD
jgi:hypothetical protein